MKVNVGISGVGTSSARMRALALVREAIAKREAEAQSATRLSSVAQSEDHHQHMRGK